MERLGTNYGGWLLPKNTILNEKSIVYSGGIGEDMSFDIKLVSKYKCNVFLIDPTLKAKTHFEEYKKYILDKEYKFKGNIQPDYYYTIKNEKHDISRMKYLDIGIWNKKDTLKFYRQDNNEYVSQSLIDGMFGEKYDVIQVDSIKNIMKQNNHTNIDLLKLDIEGAENIVLNQMLNDKIYPKYLCIEFDLFIKKKDTDDSTRKIVNRLLMNGYKILINDNFNITFERN